MSLPKKLYVVRVIKDPNGRYGDIKGGTFTQLKRAWMRLDRIVQRGGEVKLYETECDWTELDPDLVRESFDSLPEW